MKYYFFIIVLCIITLWWCVENNEKSWNAFSNNGTVIHSSQRHVFEKIWVQSIDNNKVLQWGICDNEKEPQNLLLWPIVCYNISWYRHTYTIPWLNMVIYPRTDDFVFSEKNPYLLLSWDYKNFVLKNNIITLTDTQFPITIEKISKNWLSIEEIISNSKNMVISWYELWELYTWINSKILSWTYTIYNLSYKKSSESWDEIISKSYIFSSDINIPYYYIYMDSSLNDGSERRSSMYPIQLFIN